MRQNDACHGSCCACSTPTRGTLTFAGRDLLAASAGDLRRLRKDIQVVFQDPYSSLDPRATVGDSIAEGLRAHGVDAAERTQRVCAVMELVGLDPKVRSRFPHEFSGGQRQRIGIARALVVEPKFLIADEPVSALDVSIRSQILNLFRDLQRRLGFTILFVSHDLAVVEHLCDRVAVMYLGQIVEVAGRDELFANPRHPYTKALLSSVPIPDPVRARRAQADHPHRRRPVPGEPPERVPVPPALPRSPRGCLPGHRAGARGCRGRAPGSVPLRHGRAAGARRDLRTAGTRAER